MYDVVILGLLDVLSTERFFVLGCDNISLTSHRLWDIKCVSYQIARLLVACLDTAILQVMTKIAKKKCPCPCNRNDAVCLLLCLVVLGVLSRPFLPYVSHLFLPVYLDPTQEESRVAICDRDHINHEICPRTPHLPATPSQLIILSDATSKSKNQSP